MEKTPIVITGVGVVTPVGIGKDAFWESLVAGKSGVGRITFFDVSDYPSKIDAEVKNFVPENYIEDRKRIKHMDRFAQFAYVAAQLAIEDSGLELEKENKDRIGVIVGSGIGGLYVIEKEYQTLLHKGVKRVSPFLIPMLITDIAPGEIAIGFGLRGPNYSISSACATSAHTVGDALRLLRYGDADVIICGGTEAAITTLGFAGFCSIRALSTRNDAPEKASRPFDAQRDGFVMGEGAGIIVLETLNHARARGAKIYAELAGYGATEDAYHITAPAPSAEASAQGMRLALADGNIRPEEIDYINAHGTSTQLNDKTETLAIKKVFGERAYAIPISSTKSMIGHLLGAGGAVELVACLLSMQKGIIHPTINYEFPDKECDLDYVPNKARAKEVRVALSNSLGFGGHNASLVVKKLD